MEAFCDNCEELIEVLNSYGRMNEYHFKRNTEEGFMVTSKVRKEFLTSTYQGKYIINGRVYRILFENLLGGVWKVKLGDL